MITMQSLIRGPCTVAIVTIYARDGLFSRIPCTDSAKYASVNGSRTTENVCLVTMLLRGLPPWASFSILRKFTEGRVDLLEGTFTRQVYYFVEEAV